MHAPNHGAYLNVNVIAGVLGCDFVLLALKKVTGIVLGC